MTTAAVVGSGPNGLAAALTLARAGISVAVFEASDRIGGGARTSEKILPGLRHDDCSAFHPIAAAAPFLSDGLDGLRWLKPPIDCAHPLDDGSASLLHTSVEKTASGLGPDGDAWRRLFGPLSDRLDSLLSDATQPVLRVPRHPIGLARFGTRALLPATQLARRWRYPPARALWSGIAAHALHPLTRPMTSAVGLTIAAAGHSVGWVVAEGGSQSIVDSMAREIERLGGVIETGQQVGSLRALDSFDLVMLDVAPGAAADLAGDRMPTRIAKAFRSYRHGPAAFKVDFAVEDGVPWMAEGARAAGTVHLGGTIEEVEAVEREVFLGRMPDRPFVLVGQQFLADPSRSVGNVHPVWTYAHVPNGFSGDATEAIVRQIERFAPGFRDRVLGSAVRSVRDLQSYNQNFVGGDIIGGAGSPMQLLFRPRFSTNPYSTGVPGVYICSASTPPGAGAHGMGGFNAASRALARI